MVDAVVRGVFNAKHELAVDATVEGILNAKLIVGSYRRHKKRVPTATGNLVDAVVDGLLDGKYIRCFLRTSKKNKSNRRAVFFSKAEGPPRGEP